jgi:glutamate-1-semialdehyde 2,1-aminomutase
MAAIVGSDEWREAASQIFVTGSFWYNSVPMAAAIATIHEIQDKNVPKKLEELGNRIKKTFEAQALSCGLKVSYTGHVSMPYLTFDIDKSNKNYALMETFCNEMLNQGVYVAPRHNWFFSLAHLDAGIEDRIYQASEASFTKVKIRAEAKAFQ